MVETLDGTGALLDRAGESDETWAEREREREREREWESRYSERDRTARLSMDDITARPVYV